MKFLAALLASGFLLNAEARVFVIGEESLAAYFRGSYWTGALTNTLMSDSNGPTSVEVRESFSYSSSGELGMVYATQGMNLRLGLEFIRPPEIKNEEAVNSSLAPLYNVTSELSVIVPKVGLEIGFSKTRASRAFLYLGAGMASLVARNSYVFTAQGLTDLGVAADYFEDLRGSSTLLESSLGFESILSDTTTFSFEAGYRDLKFTSVKHNRDITTMSQGAVSKGDTALNTDGSGRAINLSSPFLVLQFRFWIN